MRLYELASAYRMLSEIEDAAAFDAALTELQDSIEAKAENIAALVRELEAEATAYEGEWKRLKAQQDTRLRKVERLKDYLKQSLEAAGLPSLKVGLFTVAVQQNPPTVNVPDGAPLPEQFVRVIPEQRVADRKALLDAYKQGEELPEGVEIVRGTHLRIR